MRCEDYKRWFSPYIDGQLSAAERTHLEEHLNSCAACASDLKSLQGMLQQLSTMEQPETPNLLTGIHAKLETAPAAQPIAWRLPLGGLAVAATAVLVLVIGTQVYVKRGVMEGMPHASDALSLRKTAPTQEMAQASQFQRSGRADKNSPAAERLLSEADKPAQKEAGLDDYASALGGSIQREQLTGISGIEDKKSDSGRKEENVLLEGMSAPSEEPASPLQAAPVTVSVSASVVVGATAEVPARQLVEGKFKNSEPAATATSSPAVDPYVPVQAQWKVSDFSEAASQIQEWIRAREGFAIATNEHHLSVKLPGKYVHEFLQKFTTSSSTATSTDYASLSLWLTISLELVSQQ